jgi:hypothetical protein
MLKLGNYKDCEKKRRENVPSKKRLKRLRDEHVLPKPKPLDSAMKRGKPLNDKD